MITVKEIYDMQDRIFELYRQRSDLLIASKGLMNAIGREIDGKEEFFDSPIYAWISDVNDAILQIERENDEI